MEAWNAPLSAMRTLPSHVNQVTGPNGVLKVPVAFTVSPTTPPEVSGVPVADNVVVGANGVCASREAWKPPSEVGRTLPSTVNHFTVPSGVLKVPVAFTSAPELVWVAPNDNAG